MNRRSFINRLFQAGVVVATGLPVLSSEASEASAVAADKGDTFIIGTGNVGLGNPNPTEKLIVSMPIFPEDNYVYVGEPVAPNVEIRYRYGWHTYHNSDEEEFIINKNWFVHKKYFLVALLKDTETKKI